MSKTKLLFLLIISLNYWCLNAQIHQSMRGIVIDKLSEIPLQGVKISIEGTNPLITAISNEKGEFLIKDIPIGKYTIGASLLGYEAAIFPNTYIGSGKQAELNISLDVRQTTIKEVIITNSRTKNETVNSMNFISGRTFSVEETRRYAGGLDDPARMVSAFAGVSTGDIQNNALIIRGNNPKYTSWNLEGVEIPAPNHLSNINLIGGGLVSILSNQLLTSSDFFTGAFAAEYGNALSGVFDMRMRSGNNQKREYTFQISDMGIDFAAEGPFVKGKSASYLINYRYSTFSLISFLLPTTQVPNYQDLSFKFNFPTKKLGTFSLWGVGGIDNIVDTEKKDSSTWTYDSNRYSFSLNESTGAIGLTHKIIFGSQTYINSSLVASAYGMLLNEKRLNNNLISEPDLGNNTMEGKFTFKTFINHKFSDKHTNRTGIMLNNLFYKLKNSVAINQTPPMVTLNDEIGSTNRLEAYTQSQISTAGLKFNVGFHATYFRLNNEFILEPRLGISKEIGESQKISFGYGKHSSLEPLRVYFYQENGTLNQPNKNLKLTKAHHFILGYDFAINKNLRIKIEPYYQFLFDVPVIKDSVYSILNIEQYFDFRNRLTNEGKGRNYGVDFTLEKFYNNNYYFLFTGSVFKSQYLTSKGETYSTRYDKGFTLNILSGKDFVFGKKNRNTISINERFSVAGGYKTTPINMVLSQQAKVVTFDWTKPYSDQNPTNCYLDLGVSWRKDKKNVASIICIQIKNVLGARAFYSWAYNRKTQSMEFASTAFIYPYLTYRLEF